MSPDPSVSSARPPLAYALPDAADVRMDQARRVFGWAALAYAITSVGSVAFPLVAMWGMIGTTSWRWKLTDFTTAVACLPIVAGAASILLGRPAGWLWVRAATAVIVAVTLGVSAWAQLVFVTQPATATTYRAGTIVGAVLVDLSRAVVTVPTLLFALTFPLRRRAAADGDAA